VATPPLELGVSAAPVTVPRAEPSTPARPAELQPSRAPGGSSSTPYVVGLLAVSGTAAVASVVFGVLALRSADRCGDHSAYDRNYQEDCERDFPRYRALWQAFAIGGAGALAVGGTIWWLDTSSATSLGVAHARHPKLYYRYRF
jgi:hypothetical protein